MISNPNLTFWKIWYNDYKRVIPDISHEELSLAKDFFSRLPVSMLHHSNLSILE